MAMSIQHRPRWTDTYLQIDGCLIVWRGGGIVLLGEAHGDHWIVSRGWLGPETLTDVRRWTFSTPEAFGVQFRRLVREATGHRRDADAIGAAAMYWAVVSN